MYFRNIATAVAGAYIVAAAPLATTEQKRDVIVQQTVVEPPVVVVNQNLGLIDALAQQAEQQFAALVQSQLTLINTVEAIKNNIRVNTFKSRWNTVNTVLVTVTNVVDARDPANVNTRYMVNQLKADNGNPGQEIIVMMTAADALTIGPQPTPAGLQVPGAVGAGNAVTQPTAAPQIRQFDAAAPFGQVGGGAVLLPFNTTAPQPPSAAQVFPDPAAIILPNQNLFVGDVAQIQADAALIAAGSLFNLQQQLLAEQAVAQAQLAGLVLGSAPPPTVLVNTGDGQQNQNQTKQQDQAKQQEQAKQQDQAKQQGQAKQQDQGQQKAQAQQGKNNKDQQGGEQKKGQ